MTNDSLARSWQTVDVRAMASWMKGVNGAIAVMRSSDLVKVRVLLVLEERADGRFYTSQEIDYLLVLVEAVSEMLATLEVGERGRTQGKMEAIQVLGATIGHDLKQHFAALQMFTQRIEEAPDDREFLLRYLPVVRRELNVLAQFSQQLLAFGSPSFVEKADEDVGEVIEDVVGLIAERAKAAGVVVERRVEERLPKVSVDRRHLDRALMNLCVNAIEAMAPSLAESVVPVRRLEVAAKRTRGEVCITVSDTGPGISEHMLTQLFDPFVSSSKPDGSGLGLYIAWDAVIKNGGRLEHERPSAGGACFVISLPLIS
jgi:signal transduction histidine kinase